MFLKNYQNLNFYLMSNCQINHCTLLQNFKFYRKKQFNKQIRQK